MSLLFTGFSLIFAIATIADQNFLASVISTTISLICIGWVLFELKGTTILTIDKSFLKVQWSIFGFGREKIRKTKNLVKISEDVVYNQNYQPVYGVGLFFKYEKDIEFGSRLREAERKWLIGELYELKFKLATEREKSL